MGDISISGGSSSDIIFNISIDNTSATSGIW